MELNLNAPTRHETYLVNELVLKEQVMSDVSESEGDNIYARDSEPLVGLERTTDSISYGTIFSGQGKWIVHETLPAAAVVSDAALFQHLLLQWYGERGLTSSITKMMNCIAYRQIIGMGERALPLILRQLEIERDDPDHWHGALVAITRTNPVPEADLGNTRKMANAWLAWSRRVPYAR